MTKGSDEINRHPEGWADSTEAQRMQWAADAETILEERGEVPRNSLYSFAVVWLYEREKRAARQGEKNDDFQEGYDNQEPTAEAVA